MDKKEAGKVAGGEEGTAVKRKGEEKVSDRSLGLSRDKEKRGEVKEVSKREEDEKAKGDRRNIDIRK